MNVQTYLFFQGNCREAIEFYKAVFGASVEHLMTFGEGPQEFMPPDWADKVFHSTIRFGDSLVNMSDTPKAGPMSFNGFAMLAHLESTEAGERIFAALEDGGRVLMPLQATFWSACYGIVDDRFGVTWKIQA